MSTEARGIINLISGFVWMLYVGSHFMIGNLSSYFVSYFDEATSAEAQTLFPVVVFTSIFSNFAGTHLLKNKILAPKVIIIIGGGVGLLGAYFSSQTKNW